MSKSKKKRPVGLPPGTLIFKGEQMVDQPNVSLVQYTAEDFQEVHLKNQKPPTNLNHYLQWYDVRGVHDTQVIERIGQQFGLHPLILEDIMSTQQRPKLEVYDNGLFITLRALKLDKKELELEIEQISLFLGEGFVLSFQEDEEDLFAVIRQRIKLSKGKIRTRGADYLVYALLDTVVDNYFVLLDHIDEVLDQLEEEITLSADKAIKHKIHQLRLINLHFRKSALPLREVINQFSRMEDWVEESSKVFLRDLYDHILRVSELVETYRDMLNGLYDLYLSEISLKMNNVMQVLTVISTIFIPLTFLVGVYGMNFQYFPELQWRWGYPILWAVMIIISAYLFLYFRRKKWL